MTNGLFGGCFGHFNMSHHLNVMTSFMKFKCTCQFLQVLNNCQKNSASNLVKDLLFLITMKEYQLLLLHLRVFYHLQNEFNLFSWNANNAVLYCYKGCYFIHQNIVWLNSFTKIPELNVQANYLNSRKYAF